MTTDTKPSLSNLHVLLCLCVLQKATAHVNKKVLKILHGSQKVFCGIFFGIPQHQKGYLIYVSNIRKIVSSHDVVFEKTFSSALEYTSFPYSESLTMQPVVSYIPNATSYYEQTGNIINFAQFEEGNLVENELNA